jgi:diguanylate cyclase
MTIQIGQTPQFDFIRVPGANNPSTDSGSDDSMTRLRLFLQGFFVLLAIRRPLDVLVKPLLFMVIIHATANLCEWMILGPRAWALADRTLLTTITALPFMALVFAVVTHLDRVQQQLAELATTDALTGLRNRRSFLEQSHKAHADHRHGVLFILDADYFKSINDKHGHAVGDICLQAIARHMRDSLRRQDIIGRVGGEEFAVYLPDAPLSEARQIGQRLTGAITVELGTPDMMLTLTMSVGATQTQNDQTLEHFLTLADLALYQAKENGRARVVFWDGQAQRAA